MKKLFLCAFYGIHTLHAISISFISSPFLAHFYTLQKTACAYKQAHPKDAVHFYVLNFPNMHPSASALAQMQSHNIATHTITPQNPIKNTTDTFARVAQYTPTLLQALQPTDLIIYDYICLEAYIAGQVKHIPTLCSMTGSTIQHEPDNPYFLEELKKNKQIIAQLEHTYNLDIFNHLEWKFVKPFLPSEQHNVLYGYPLFLQNMHCAEQRNLHDTYFTIDQEPLKNSVPFTLPKIQPEQKLIYISFGSWIGKPKAQQDFLKNVYTWLIDSFTDTSEYIFIIGHVMHKNQYFPYISSNFYVYESMVPQEEILQHADLFITHAGAHSLNESITHEVPMIAIPFCFDQHAAARNISDLNIGLSFLHTPEIEEKAVFINSTHIQRTSLTQNSLKLAIIEILHNSELYIENIKRIKEIKPQSFVEIIEKIIEDQI